MEGTYMSNGEVSAGQSNSALREAVNLLDKRVTTLEKLIKSLSHDISDVDHRTSGMIRLGPSHD